MPNSLKCQAPGSSANLAVFTSLGAVGDRTRASRTPSGRSNHYATGPVPTHRLAMCLGKKNLRSSINRLLFQLEADVLITTRLDTDVLQQMGFPKISNPTLTACLRGMELRRLDTIELKTQSDVFQDIPMFVCSRGYFGAPKSQHE